MDTDEEKDYEKDKIKKVYLKGRNFRGTNFRGWICQNV